MFFEQLEEAAVGSSISLIVANLCMEDFEIKTINAAENPLRICKKFVHDTLWSQSLQRK